MKENERKMRKKERRLGRSGDGRQKGNKKKIIYSF